MRALVAKAVGEPAEVLDLQHVPVPEPQPGQVLVHVRATPVHPSDLHTIRGRYGVTSPAGMVPGQEAVGTVEAVGDGVDTVRPGDRVITVGVAGTWQEYVVADASQVLPVPDHLTDSTAAQLITNPLTAWLLVTDALTVGPDEWLLQTAAGSTVGRLVIQLSAHLDFRTINVVRRRATAGEIREVGVTEVVCTEDEDLVEAVSRLAGDRPVGQAIDCVAGQVGADAFQALAPGGSMVVYGAMATHRQTDPSALTLPLFARSLIYGCRTVRGFWLRRWFGTTPPERIQQALGEVVGLVTKGVLTIPEGQPFEVERAAEAMRTAEAPAHGSKPLLVF